MLCIALVSSWAVGIWMNVVAESVAANLTYLNSTSSPSSPRTPNATSTATCSSLACQLGIGYVNVFYWPVSSSNTDCLKSIATTYLDRREYNASETRPASTIGNAQNGSIQTYVNSDGFILYYHHLL